MRAAGRSALFRRPRNDIRLLLLPQDGVILALLIKVVALCGGTSRSFRQCSMLGNSLGPLKGAERLQINQRLEVLQIHWSNQARLTHFSMKHFSMKHAPTWDADMYAILLHLHAAL